MRMTPILPALLLLTACGEGTITSARGKLEAIKPVHTLGLNRPSSLHVEAGLESIIGADRSRLEQQFGTPRLDVREGDALKLQWSGTPCVLDVYLYPPARGGEPSVSFVDARRGDGRDVDKAACVTALKQGK